MPTKIAPNRRNLIAILIKVKTDKGKVKRSNAKADDYNRFSDTIDELYRFLDLVSIDDLERMQ